MKTIKGEWMGGLVVLVKKGFPQVVGLCDTENCFFLLGRPKGKEQNPVFDQSDLGSWEKSWYSCESSESCCDTEFFW